MNEPSETSLWKILFSNVKFVVKLHGKKKKRIFSLWATKIVKNKSIISSHKNDGKKEIIQFENHISNEVKRGEARKVKHVYNK